MSAAKPSRRQLQKDQTKYAIVDAARHLFAEHGYARTSVSQIAQAAGVSVQTIYDSVGSKADLVRELNDLLDAEGDVGPLAARIPTAESPRELLEIATQISRNINERCDDLVAAIWSGAAADPELDHVRAEGQRRHREGIGFLCRRLDEIGALRNGLDLTETTDVVAAMTDLPLARVLVHQYGWTWDRWQVWTIDALTRLIVTDSRTADD